VRQQPEDDGSVVGQTEVVVATSLAGMISHLIFHFNYKSLPTIRNKIYRILL